MKDNDDWNVYSFKDWIGANDQAEEGNFTWAASGMTIKTNSNISWRNKQPDNRLGNEDCVQIYREQEMNDFDCERTIPFSCQTGKCLL